MVFDIALALGSCLAKTYERAYANKRDQTDIRTRAHMRACAREYAHNGNHRAGL